MKFYINLLIELIFFPFLYAWEAFKNFISSNGKDNNITHITETNFKPINNIVYLIHEWAKYPIERKKKINVIPEFECGFLYQVQRINNYNGVKKIQKYITISDYSDAYVNYLNENNINLNNYNVIPVENISMDFSGYSYLIKNILDPNQDQVVFLTNTSVEKHSSDFIDDYVGIFEKYPNLGLLGISYSTKRSQSLIKNKFLPHLQSFFLVSKSRVLKQVVDINKGNFPGEKETFKYSIIRFGEIRLSKLVSKLGYDVAVVEPDGEVYFFPKSTPFDNGYNSWKLPYDDRRLTNNTPNRIHSLKNFNS